MSLRSLVSLSRRRRPVQSAVRTPAARSAAPAAASRLGVETLETRVFLSADVLTPVADTFVRDPSWNTTNFGNSPFLYVKQAGSGDDRHALLRFNIGNFDEEIGNATLYLAGALQTPSTPPIEIGIYPVADTNWVEGNGTIAVRDRDGGGGGSQLSGTSPGDGYDRDNSPSGEVTWDTQPSVTGPALTTALVSRESFQTYAFDITAYIQQARQAGNQFVTLGVRSTQPTIHMTRVISREFDGPGRPQLVLTEAGDADGSVVRATVNAPDVTVGGSPSHNITVTYSGTAPIDLGTIDANDIVVTRDGGSPINVEGVTFDPPFPSSTVTATYTVRRGSAWEVTDNDLYTVHVRRGEVRDAEGNELVSNFSSFRSRVFDTTAPTATVNAGNITGGGSDTYSFTVNYADNIAIDSQTINVNNVSVTDPNGGRHHPLRVTLSPDDGDASQILATYTIAAPGGDWGAEDNGTYSITLHTQTARDTAVNEVAEFVTPFDVNVQGPDVEGPTASISSGDITAESNGSHTVTVLYSDDRGINTGSIGTGDIIVTDPNGVALNVTDVDVSPGGGGSPQTAVYTIAPPAGGWNTNANGAYTVTLKPNEVSDSSDNFAAAATGGFNVNITPPPPADTAPPTASISPVNVSSGGGGTHSITVTYDDNNAVVYSSIGRDDVVVTGPGGITLGVSGVSAAPAADAATIAVTYQIDAPGGTWDDEDDGAYTITVKPGAVHDAANNLNSEISAGFTVDIGGPDTAGPSSDIQVEDVTVAGGATHQISITYTDDGKVDFTTIDAGDITVVRESDGLVLSVTAGTATLPGHGSPKTGVYTIQAPGGSWDATDDGVYRVTLLPGAVADRKPNFAATNSRTFSVRTAVVDTTPPTASIAPPAPVTTAGDALVSVLVTYADNQPLSDTVIDKEDLLLTGPNGVPFAATTAQVLPGTDPNTITVRYDFAAPGGTWDVSDNGTYSITLAPGQVTDAAGNPVTLVGTGQLVVDVPAPDPIDPVFGSGNPIATNFVVEAVTAQPDGKLVLVGRRGVAGTPETVGVIQRRNPDGSLDSSFGGGDGEVVTDAGQGTIYYAVGLPSDGRIVVSGTAFGAVDGDFVAARYDAAGNLDATFGAGGRVFVDFGQPGEAAYGLAVGPDNKIVLGGGSADHFAFARLSPDGSLDATFAQGGKNLFDADGVDVVAAVAIQRDGKVLASGSSGPNVVVIRLDVNGEKDLGFADQGVLIVPGLRSRLEAQDDVDRSQALAVQSDDRILVGNYTADGNFGVARVDLAGRLDPTFGTAGIASVDLGGNDDVDAVVIQETGEILAVGTTDAGNNPVTAVAAFNTSGQLITGFGENGVLRFDPAVSTPGREVHIGDLVLRAFGTRQADGRLVVTSSDRRPDPTSSSLRRLIVPGSRILPTGPSIGTFGATAGSRRGQRLVDTVTGAIFTMKGGTGEAFRGDDGRINLILADGGAGVVVNVKARGRVPLGDIICRGNVRSLNIRTGDLSGTLFVGGMLFRARLGNVAGGTIAVNGAITSLLVDNLDQAKILSGANLGEDARLGGTESNADVFGVGVIGAVKVRGQIVNSIVAAGLNPNDGVIGNDDDTVTAGSTLRTLSAKGADENSRFYASTFGNVRLPRRIDPATDPRFETA